jgi:transcription initiation factor TFIIB
MSVQNTDIDSAEAACPSCQGKIISDLERGERICSHCAIVIDDHSHPANSESANFFSYFENEDVREPTSLMMYEIGLPTFINKKNVDAAGKQIRGGAELEKLRRLNKFTISNDSKTRNLNKAIREIRRISEILGISPSIAERASYIYRKALNRKMIRGRSITGIVAATIYIACKDAGVFFPIDRIEKLGDNCNRKNVIHYYKLLLRQMKINVGVPDPVQYVSRIAARARLSGRTERRALEILSQVEGDPGLSGKKPASLAAASLYLSALRCGEHTTQLRVAIASELTTITIRKRCLEIDNILKQMTDKSSLFSKQIENTNSISAQTMPQEVIPITPRKHNNKFTLIA